MRLGGRRREGGPGPRPDPRLHAGPAAAFVARGPRLCETGVRRGLGGGACGPGRSGFPERERRIVAAVRAWGGGGGVPGPRCRVEPGPGGRARGAAGGGPRHLNCPDPAQALLGSRSWQLQVHTHHCGSEQHSCCSPEQGLAPNLKEFVCTNLVCSQNAIWGAHPHFL